MNNFYSKIDKGTEFIDKSGTKYTFKKYRPSGRYNNKNQKEVWIYTYEMEKKKPIETISIKELATSVNKKINGVISYKSKSGSYYIDLPMDDIKIRISDHYILSRDSLNPKSSNDIDYVRKDFTKSDIQELIDEIEEYKKDSFKKGGKVDTYKDKYNRKYKFKKGQSNSLKEIAETTGIGMKGIQQIYNKGIGAYKTNPSSVRPNVKSKEQWAYARVYSAVMGGKASKIDKNELKMEKGGEIYNAHIITNDNNMRTTTEKYYSKEHKEVGTYAKGGKTNTKNMKPKNQTKKGREIKITKINDIANLKEEIELGNVTYRGLGMGKLFDRFYEIANENGTRIKVKGQEYYITETEFDKISRGSDGKLKIKFDAPKRNYAKGGKVKKFPISVQRRVDEINAMLPKVLDSDNYPSTYAGSTVEGYVVLEKPIEIKNQYVYINADKIKDNYPFEKRYNVNDRDTYASYNGRKALMYDLGIIKRAFTKLLKNDSSYAVGGEVVFTDLSDNTQSRKEWEGRKSKNTNQNSFGSFSNKVNNRMVGSYYIYRLTDFDEKYYAHVPLKDEEILVRVETDNIVGGEMPLVKINISNGRVYFMSEDNDLNSDYDDKNPKFNKASADVLYLSLDKALKKYESYSKKRKSKKFSKGGKTEIGIYEEGGDIKGGEISKELNLQGLDVHSDNTTEVINLLKKYNIRINNSKPQGTKGYGVEFDHTNTDYYEYWFNTYDVDEVDELFGELETLINDKEKDVEFIGYMGDVKDYDEAFKYAKGGKSSYTKEGKMGEGYVIEQPYFDEDEIYYGYINFSDYIAGEISEATLFYTEREAKAEAKDFSDEAQVVRVKLIDDDSDRGYTLEAIKYAKGGEIETWREGDEVMVLMRGTKASGYQKAIITGIDKENGILTETDNPETLLAVYSKEEKLSDEIFAREIKSFPSPATKKEEYIDPITQSHIDYEKEKSERLYNSDSWVDAQRNAEGFAKGGVIYKHKHIPTMTFEITGETKNGYKGIQKDKKSLSRLEKTKGKSASYSSSELKDLFNKETFAKGGSLEAHALEVGDEILGFDFGEAYVIKKGVVFIVDLKNGTRRKTKLSKQDAVSTFAKGGMTNNFDSDFMDLVKG